MRDWKFINSVLALLMCCPCCLEAAPVATLDDGNLLFFVSNNGIFSWDPDRTRGEPSGLYYPKDTYRSLMAMGALWVFGRRDTLWHATLAGSNRNWRRLNGRSEFRPGPAEQAYDSGYQYPVYKITRGRDEELIDDYRKWPTSDGAATGFFGAPVFRGSQTLFTVFSDVDSTLHDFLASGTPPLGVEVTLHAYTYDDVYQLQDTMLVQTIFLDYTVTNMTDEFIDSLILTVWSDPDIGYSASDRVGCDSSLAAGYCYNDQEFDIYSGFHPPVVGFTFLDDGLFSFNYFPFRDTLPNFVNLARGLTDKGNAYIDPKTNLPTRYPFNGNPVSGTGWLNNSSADYRIMLNSIPSILGPHQSINLKVALVVAQGSSVREGIERFLETVGMLRRLYRLEDHRPRVETNPEPAFTLAGRPVFGNDWGGRFLSGGLDLASRYFDYSQAAGTSSLSEIRFSKSFSQRGYRFRRVGNEYWLQNFTEQPLTVNSLAPYQSSHRTDYAFIDFDGDGTLFNGSGGTDPIVVLTTPYSDSPKSEITGRFLDELGSISDFVLQLDGVDPSSPDYSFFVSPTAMRMPFSLLQDTVRMLPPAVGDYSEQTLVISNPTLFTQEINIVSSDPLHLFVQPSRFELGARETGAAFVHYSPRDQADTPGLLTVYSFGYRNEQRLYHVLLQGSMVMPKGDINGDSDVNLVDLLLMINFYFQQSPIALPLERVDSDCNGLFDLSDLIRNLNLILFDIPLNCSGHN